jgi:two-component system, NarL family, response regulator LiaR
MPQVTIVEDNKQYQQTLVTLLEDSIFRVNKVYSSAEDVMPVAEKLSGIIIIDIQLPGMNGDKLVRYITERNPTVQCIICSLYDDDEFIFSALKNGALGYLLKDSTGDHIIEALTELHNGGSPMSPYIARRVIQSLQQSKKDVTEVLTHREKEVLEYIARGLIYKQIADQLSLSYETVKQHIKKIYQKLHVENKVQALNKLRGNA